MTRPKITLTDFTRLISRICSRDTSSDPDNWSEENPTWGHCAPVSLLVQDEFGGSIVQQSLRNNPEFASMRSHFSNKIANGKLVDFTVDQFQGKLDDTEKEEKPRERILSYPDTQKRYELLRARFKKALTQDDPFNT